MGMIGRWIDERCAEEPEVMRRVLNRKWGSLSEFFDGNKCGCLVGTYALCREATVGAAYKLLSGHRLHYMIGVNAWRLVWHRRKRLLALPMTTWSEAEAYVVRLLKQRIRRALGLAIHEEPSAPLSAVGTSV